MATPPFWPVWLQQLSVHQDYLWFAVLLSWGMVLMVWWWHPARAEAWGWVPWVAVSGVYAAAVQFAIFNPPFDLFHSRLVPGTVADYRPALIRAEELGDWLLGLLHAATALGWTWRVCRRNGMRAVATAFALTAAALHVDRPLAAGVLAGLLWLAAAVAEWPQVKRPVVRVALAGSVLLPWLSTVGPVAAAWGMLQRSGPPTPLGCVAAAWQIAVAALVFAALAPRVLGAAGGSWRRRELRWGLIAALLWLAAGLGFAHRTGEDNRQELHQNRLRTTAARASLFDDDVLRLLEAPAPAPVEVAWEGVPEDELRAALPPAHLARSQALSRALLREQRAVPYIRGARVIVAADGWLYALASSHPAPEPGTVDVLRRLTPQDEADWAAGRNLVETAPVAEIGQPYYCRAALHAPDGRMLGWLEFEQVEFFQSIARKWRSGPLLITALGLLLGGTFMLQRRAAREREAALRVAAVEAEASRAKSAFLATVSHELRTPLQSLLGYGELLRDRLAGDAEAAAWLRAVRQHGELMTRLVNDLIDLGALQAGTFRLAPRVIAPGALVRDTVESLRVRAAAKGLSLECTVGDSMPPAVRADNARLRQIVFNLAGNAVKFTTAGSVRVRLDAQPATDGMVRLALRVTDTGPGIAPEDQTRLFRPFERLAATAEQEGAGLGLALTAALCRAHGGDVTVVSDGRHGATFTATLTVAPATADELAPPTAEALPPASSLAGRRVLVVDDNALVRDLFVAILQAAGASVRLAATPASALATARHGDVDVIVLDLALPGMSGLDLAPRLRELLPRARIVGASAHAGAAERAAALAAGMDDFVVKPVTPAALIAAVSGGASVAPPPAPPPAWQAELARGFRRDVAPRRAPLAAAAAAGDWPQVRERAHYLANSAAAVRDDRLLAACAALVRAVEAGLPEEQRRAAARACDAELARIAGSA